MNLLVFSFSVCVTFLFCALQYLKDEDEDLVSPPNMEGNQWVTFVKQSTYLKGGVTFFH